jgi:chromate reductase, NAD(P)H dehydrogenase (quinone)
MSKRKISVIVGSLRKGSFNKKIAIEVMKISSPDLEFEILEIGQLGYYNEDLDQGNPPKD